MVTPLWICLGCGAMRAATVAECFCRETAVREAPPLPCSHGVRGRSECPLCSLKSDPLEGYL